MRSGWSLCKATEMWNSIECSCSSKNWCKVRMWCVTEMSQVTRARTLLKCHVSCQEVGYFPVSSEDIEDFKQQSKNEMSSVLLIPSFDYNTRLFLRRQTITGDIQKIRQSRNGQRSGLCCCPAARRPEQWCDGNVCPSRRSSSIANQVH